jgi:hypothetical protein
MSVVRIWTLSFLVTICWFQGLNHHYNGINKELSCLNFTITINEFLKNNIINGLMDIALISGHFETSIPPYKQTMHPYFACLECTFIITFSIIFFVFVNVVCKAL